MIYARVSNDPTGQGRSTESQVAECQSICQREGWEVAEVLIDNDRGASRYSAKDRPEYKRLTKILKPGHVLVTWEASRAQRDLAAYVDLRNLCAERGVLWSYSGRTYDLTNGDDRFGTGLDALLAEREAEQIRERVLRGKRAAAVAGRPAGRPPWGYRRQIDPDTGKTLNWEIDPVDGPIVLDVIKRTLAGESLWAIVRDLEARGIEPRQVQRNAAKKWRPQSIRVTISSPTYAGLRTHQGEVIGKGIWEPMISVEEHQRLLAIFSDPARRSTTHRGVEPRHLLTGIARCGVCGEPMRWSGPRSEAKVPGYLCSGRSCVRRRADLVDLLVTQTIVNRLSRPDAVALFSKLHDDDQVAEALALADTLKKRLNGFVDAAAAGELSPAALARIEATLLPQIADAEARMRANTEISPLVDDLIGPDAQNTWDSFTVIDRRAVVRSLIEVKVMPVTYGNTQRFDPRDVEIRWRQSQE